MTPALEAKLVADFPGLFRDYGKPAAVSCMAFGCECGDGWEPLLRSLFKSLSADCVLSQVKEKFGGLRVYTWGATDQDQDFIDFAEKQSYTICEFCGKPGKPNDRGWIITLCDYCREHPDA